jgi:hypothetical protein
MSQMLLIVEMRHVRYRYRIFCQGLMFVTASNALMTLNPVETTG